MMTALSTLRIQPSFISLTIPGYVLLGETNALIPEAAECCRYWRLYFATKSLSLGALRRPGCAAFSAAKIDFSALPHIAFENVLNLPQ